MKKLLVGIFAAGAISSCSVGDDTLPMPDNSGNNNNTNIVGVWKIQTQYQISGTNKETVIAEKVPDDCKKQGTYEFKNDGKYYMADYNNVDSVCKKTEATTPYEYNPAHMKLTIGSNVADVLELSSSKLVILVATNDDYNGDGIKDYDKTVFYK